ncbi:MAG: hypothetical protein R6W75_04055 [Smithellaceae bacterium]
MKAAVFPAGLAFVLLVSCASLPEIRPAVSASAEKNFVCPFPFPSEKTRFIHAIEARAAGKTKGAVIGVTLVDPETRHLSCAIMTAEGLVLFEADSTPAGIQIHRALPPFESPAFARNMMDDIELIFLAPSGLIEKKGFSPEGRPMCRWRQDAGGFIDVAADAEGLWRISRYNASRALSRSVRLEAEAATPFGRIELAAKGLVGYTLIMTLIETEPAGPEAVSGAGAAQEKNP